MTSIFKQFGCTVLAVKIFPPTSVTKGDGHLSEKINLHCGHLSENISGHLSDTISIDHKCGQLSDSHNIYLYSPVKCLVD